MKEMLNNKNSPTPAAGKQEQNAAGQPQKTDVGGSGRLSECGSGGSGGAGSACWVDEQRRASHLGGQVGRVGRRLSDSSNGRFLLRPPFAPERLFSGTGVRGHFVCQLPALLAGGGGATRLVGSCQAVFHAAVRVHLRQHRGQCQTKGLIEAGGDFSPPAFVCNGYTEG